jgi:alcohol dehydrogenase class IV
VLPAIAAAAAKDRCHPTNPREASESEYRALLEVAYG